MNLKSLLWQGSLLGLIVSVLFILTNINLVRGLLRTDRHSEDFGYGDTHFVVYHGPFQGSPWLAASCWLLLIFIASIIALTIFKLIWFAFRKRGLTPNR